jgi:hypothetical protein
LQWLTAAGRLEARRRAQDELWYRTAIRERLGRDRAAAARLNALEAGVSPFRAIRNAVAQQG